MYLQENKNADGYYFRGEQTVIYTKSLVHSVTAVLTLLLSRDFMTGIMLVLLVSKRKVKIMFSKRFDGKQTNCYFPLLAKVPIKMRKYCQQMRNAVA